MLSAWSHAISTSGGDLALPSWTRRSLASLARPGTVYQFRRVNIPGGIQMTGRTIKTCMMHSNWLRMLRSCLAVAALVATSLVATMGTAGPLNFLAAEIKQRLNR
jgi:hypothetical protein